MFKTSMRALVEVVKMLNAKRKQAEAAAAGTRRRESQNRIDEARANLKSVIDMMNKLLVKMSSRKDFSISASVYFADMCLAAGLPDVARESYLQCGEPG